MLKQPLDNPTSFKVETRKALQGILAENGLHDGPADGDFGPGTRHSIRTAFGIIEVED